MEGWCIYAIAAGLGWSIGMADSARLRAQLRSALAKLAGYERAPEPPPPQPEIGHKPPEARCWASPTVDLAKHEEAVANVESGFDAFLVKRREEEAQCEMPELADPRARAFVDELRTGKPVAARQMRLAPESWRVTADGKLLESPFHHYRIDGRRLDYDRSTDSLVLLAEEWM